MYSKDVLVNGRTTSRCLPQNRPFAITITTTRHSKQLIRLINILLMNTIMPHKILIFFIKLQWDRQR